ncbi:hypothetical protein HJC99_01640 [Candidatus Saccharibacteria bacterium]|nr:hypothetical protein [Candidatus Saccharibacteria bacterium]
MKISYRDELPTEADYPALWAKSILTHYHEARRNFAILVVVLSGFYIFGGVGEAIPLFRFSPIFIIMDLIALGWVIFRTTIFRAGQIFDHVPSPRQMRRARLIRTAIVEHNYFDGPFPGLPQPEHLVWPPAPGRHARVDEDNSAMARASNMWLDRSDAMRSMLLILVTAIYDFMVRLIMTGQQETNDTHHRSPRSARMHYSRSTKRHKRAAKHRPLSEMGQALAARRVVQMDAEVIARHAVSRRPVLSIHEPMSVSQVQQWFAQVAALDPSLPRGVVAVRYGINPTWDAYQHLQELWTRAVHRHQL